MSTPTEQALEAAVVAMTDPSVKALFDVTIICTTDDHQAEYWMERLSQGVCRKTTSPDSSIFPLVLAVSEDWNDTSGAGNGLGTLYAWTKATKFAKSRHGIDLDQLLQDEQVSAALYHTAGKGTRLAPLPASENNNKPGVKIPVCQPNWDTTTTSSSSPPQLWTVLEAVVQQTGIYAPSRRGRLSVFWGDQVFVPSAPYLYTPTHHVDILCTLLGDTAPTAEEWSAQGLDKYGVIAVLEGPQENAAQVEKVSHAQATAILSSLGQIQKVGPSLGSFSVSATMLQALVTEFATELEAKVAKLDTDPHFWMPLTLPAVEYVQLMSAKGEDATFLTQHYQRMAALKDKINATSKSSLGLLGAINVGKDAGWWDYGQVKLYSKNSKLLLEPDSNHDAKLLRQFLGASTTASRVTNTSDNVVVNDEASLVSSCRVVTGGNISHSVVASVVAQSITADHAIVVNCASAKSIIAKPGSILYNIVSEDDIVAEENDVIVQVTEESGAWFDLKSAMTIDGKDAWSVVLPQNTMSFEQVHEKNFNANVRLIQEKRQERYQQITKSLGL